MEISAWIFEQLHQIKVTADTFSQYTPAAYAENTAQPNNPKGQRSRKRRM